MDRLYGFKSGGYIVSKFEEGLEAGYREGTFYEEGNIAQDKPMSKSA